MTTLHDIEPEVQLLAGQCVACGLCLPHCPTYRETRDESESPRGRLSLIRALATNELPSSVSLLAHLDRCLACRACERACPSNVPFGRLLETARKHVAPPTTTRLHRLLGALMIHPHGRNLLSAFWRFLPRAWLNGITRVSKGFGMLLAGLPDPAPRPVWRTEYPANAAPRGEVSLFTGCASDLLDRRTLTDTVAVLNLLGYTVHIPGDQTCCGAMHRVAGDPETASRLMRQNMTVFSRQPRVVLACTSGCSAALREQENIYGTEGAPPRFQDITTFLADIDWPIIALNPYRRRILVHDACLYRNALREEQRVYKLLARLPGAEVIPLPENSICCGAGSGYLLDYPNMARSLRARKTNGIENYGASVLVTTNTVCAIHLRAGLRESGANIEVLHPVTLLARQLGVAGQSALR